MFYRIKHKETGLYYCPARSVQNLGDKDYKSPNYRRYVKSNLSKKGKIYHRENPTMNNIPGSYYTHLHKYSTNQILRFDPDDWEIEEIT
jgi:hypothetical protein